MREDSLQIILDSCIRICQYENTSVFNFIEKENCFQKYQACSAVRRKQVACYETSYIFGYCYFIFFKIQKMKSEDCSVPYLSLLCSADPTDLSEQVKRTLEPRLRRASKTDLQV